MTYFLNLLIKLITSQITFQMDLTNMVQNIIVQKKSITKVAALDWKDILVDTTRLFVSINYMEVSTIFHFIDTLKTVFS